MGEGGLVGRSGRPGSGRRLSPRHPYGVIATPAKAGGSHLQLSSRLADGWRLRRRSAPRNDEWDYGGCEDNCRSSPGSTEERRVGTGSVSTCESRRLSLHYKKQNQITNRSSQNTN